MDKNCGVKKEKKNDCITKNGKIALLAFFQFFKESELKWNPGRFPDKRFLLLWVNKFRN